MDDEVIKSAEGLGSSWRPQRQARRGSPEQPVGDGMGMSTKREGFLPRSRPSTPKSLPYTWRMVVPSLDVAG